MEPSLASAYNNRSFILVNAFLKIYNNKIYSASKDPIVLKYLRIKLTDINKNDILKCTGNAIHLIDV